MDTDTDTDTVLARARKVIIRTILNIVTRRIKSFLERKAIDFTKRIARKLFETVKAGAYRRYQRYYAPPSAPPSSDSFSSAASNPRSTDSEENGSHQVRPRPERQHLNRSKHYYPTTTRVFRAGRRTQHVTPSHPSPSTAETSAPVVQFPPLAHLKLDQTLTTVDPQSEVRRMEPAEV